VTPEEGNKEPQENENPGAAPESNAAPTEAELAAIKAELEEERKAKAAAEAALTEKDTRISELEVSLAEAQGVAAQAETLKEANTAAVAKYLEAVKAANPSIPADVIAGSSIDEIDASLAKATTIAGAVKANLETQAKEAKVPAGAPTRTEISLEGLSPREKIAAGIQQKGGTT
jgi:chromosome segregation ATPase